MLSPGKGTPGTPCPVMQGASNRWDPYGTPTCHRPLEGIPMLAMTNQPAASKTTVAQCRLQYMAAIAQECSNGASE